jgi:hypothetical protein
VRGARPPSALGEAAEALGDVVEEDLRGDGPLPGAQQQLTHVEAGRRNLRQLERVRPLQSRAAKGTHKLGNLNSLKKKPGHRQTWKKKEKNLGGGSLNVPWG